eukprot:PLAT15307.2.p1 GENE.PLAT15307.2~~PLAT15307.2.p1  ORF type:complete len:141 (+),score=55.75 PLAT15307.2:327-749(+)
MPTNRHIYGALVVVEDSNGDPVGSWVVGGEVTDWKVPAGCPGGKGGLTHTSASEKPAVAGEENLYISWKAEANYGAVTVNTVVIIDEPGQATPNPAYWRVLPPVTVQPNADQPNLDGSSSLTLSAITTLLAALLGIAMVL